MKASQTTIATTVAGILAGLSIIAEQVRQMVNEGTPINWLSVVLAASIMVLGVFSKGIGNGAPPVPPAGLVLLFLLVPMLSSCASTKTSIVSATFSNGDKFPLCLEVTEQTPFGVKLLAGFCATVQQDIDAKAAEYRAVYPRARITELKGPERVTLQ